jgi:hypothetical protein
MVHHASSDSITPLPSAVLSSLYPDCLVRLQEKVPADHPQTLKTKTVETNPASPPASIGMMGENRKGIIIAVDYPDAATIRENELAFLLNILNACRLGLRDVLIVNLHGVPMTDRQQIHRKYPAEILIMFGLTPADLSLPVRFPEYQRQSFDGVQYLAAHPLERLEQDPQGKKQLWACLKALFLNG